MARPRRNPAREDQPSGDFSTPLNFAIHTTSFYDKDFPTFSQPVKLGHFCLRGPTDTNERQFYNEDDGEFKPIVRNPQNYSVNSSLMDLRKGHANHIRRKRVLNAGGDTDLHSVLQWILANREKFERLRRNKSIDIITLRYVYYVIGSVMYANQHDHGWIFVAAKFQDVIYLRKYSTDAEIAENHKHPSTQWSDKFLYWGLKFEHYMTTLPNDSAALQEPVNNNNEFDVVFHSKLNGTGILYAAEIDGYDAKMPRNQMPENFIELKTTRETETTAQIQQMLETKAHKWWAQCFAGAVPKLVIGYRTNDGLVTRLEEVNVRDLPKICRAANASWKPNVMINFVSAFFQHLKNAVKQESHQCQYMIRWSGPGSKEFEIMPLAADSVYRVLPQWYTDRMVLPHIAQ